jgi:large subunit ribosomal protein L34e
MVSGKHKSRSMRRVFRRTPGGKTVMAFKKRKPSKAKCAGCGKQLAGIPRERPRKMQNMPKTAKRPDRPYGGILCAPCTRKKILEKARKK